MNIPVIVATGNAFSGSQGEGFAAIVAGTISVTATDLSGNLLSDAQRLGTTLGGASATTLAAPGDGLTAPSGDSGTATDDGTSFSAALVSGGVTLLQDIYQSRFGTLPTVAQIKSWLQKGATPLTDPVTGITLGRAQHPPEREPRADSATPTAATTTNSAATTAATSSRGVDSATNSEDGQRSGLRERSGGQFVGFRFNGSDRRSRVRRDSPGDDRVAGKPVQLFELLGCSGSDLECLSRFL